MASGVPCFRAAAACVFLATAAALAVSASATAHVYVVGGEERGWRKPTPSDETYNHWAARNRFRVGDFLQFKYDANDSVLVVSRDDYKVCGASKPAQRFDGGDTRFRLDHSGFIYFVSGARGHCDAGQRMTARVMAPQEGGRQVVAPAAAPHAMSPHSGGGGGDDEGGSYGPGSGGGGSHKPAPGAGSGSGSGTWSRPPPSPPSASGVASVRAPSLFAGYLLHVVVGTVLSAALLASLAA